MKSKWSKERKHSWHRRHPPAAWWAQVGKSSYSWTTNPFFVSESETVTVVTERVDCLAKRIPVEKVQNLKTIGLESLEVLGSWKFENMPPTTTLRGPKHSTEPVIENILSLLGYSPTTVTAPVTSTTPPHQAQLFHTLHPSLEKMQHFQNPFETHFASFSPLSAPRGLRTWRK
jgi:hypothetical protein